MSLLHVAELVLEADDFDDEGTRWTLTGRGEPASSYSIWDMRTSIAERLTPDERERLARLRPQFAEEQIVTRITRDHGEYGDPDWAPAWDRREEGGTMSPEELDDDLVEALHHEVHEALSPDDVAKEEVLAAIRAFADREGRPPLQREAGTIGVPARGRVEDTFGGWANAVEAAGFERPKRGHRRAALEEAFPSVTLQREAGMAEAVKPKRRRRRRKPVRDIYDELGEKIAAAMRAVQQRRDDLTEASLRLEELIGDANGVLSRAD